MKKVVVLGAGALGSVYGAWLSEAGADVTLVARPAHVSAILEQGLELRSFDAPTRRRRLAAVVDPSDAGDADLVIVAAKSFDVEGLLSAYTGDARLAFSVQNGVDQAVGLQNRFGEAAVVGVSMVGGTLLGPGVAAHTYAGRTYIGDGPSTRPGASEEIKAFLPEHFEVRSDIYSVLWSKSVLAASAMGVVSLTRSFYHEVFLHPDLREVFLDLMIEAASVAHSEGVELIDLPGPLQVSTLLGSPRPAALGVLRDIGENLVATGQTQVRVSALQSIERGRPLEVDAVFAPLADRAVSRGLETPILQAVTRFVRGVDASLRAGRPLGGGGDEVSSRSASGGSPRSAPPGAPAGAPADGGG